MFHRMLLRGRVVRSLHHSMKNVPQEQTTDTIKPYSMETVQGIKRRINTIANLVPYMKRTAEYLSDISRPLTNQNAIPLFSLFAVKKVNTMVIGRSGASEQLSWKHLEMTRTGFRKLCFLRHTSHDFVSNRKWKRISHY